MKKPFLLLFFLLCNGTRCVAQDRENLPVVGKKPQPNDAHDSWTMDGVGKLPTSDTLEDRRPDGPLPDRLDLRAAPRPLTTLQNAVDFINSQRGLNQKGLPATFYMRPNAHIKDDLRQLIVSEGVGLYDTSLAVIALVEAGHLREAREILDYYVSGVYADTNPNPLELGAFPTHDNNNAFLPFSAQAHYFFDFTNVYGSWFRWGPRWKFWAAHTGPNAWLVNALVRYSDAARRQGDSEAFVAPYLQLAETVAQAMLRLQDASAYGGIRYAPRDTYHDAGLSAPYDEINSENNVSAYAALRMLAQSTGKREYAEAADRIIGWFYQSPVWTPEGQPRRGLWNAETGTFAMGAIRQGDRWVLQTEHPTDSGGTWTISALGPEKIDALWGRGTAYRMWEAVRMRAGRTPDFKYVSDGGILAGLDYNDAYPPNETLISPEWTAGGLFAVQQLLHYYGSPRQDLSPAQLAGLRRDADQMTAFVRQHSNAYAWGPGHGGQRQGQTGFHWFSPPPEVDAMSSVYVALYLAGRPDPNGWWRDRRAISPAAEKIALLRNSLSRQP